MSLAISDIRNVPLLANGAYDRDAHASSHLARNCQYVNPADCGTSGIPVIYILPPGIGADEEASNDLTASAILRGDSVLETSTAQIEAVISFDLGAQGDYAYALSIQAATPVGQGSVTKGNLSTTGGHHD